MGPIFKAQHAIRHLIDHQIEHREVNQEVNGKAEQQHDRNKNWEITFSPTSVHAFSHHNFVYSICPYFKTFSVTNLHLITLIALV